MFARVRGAGGFVTVQHLLATGLSLLLFTALANVLVVQYGRGVVRAAADEGARAGTRIAIDAGQARTRCESQATAALDDLLSGPFGDRLEVSCQVSQDRVEAVVTGSFPAWLPPYPDFVFEDRAVAIRERLP